MTPPQKLLGHAMPNVPERGSSPLWGSFLGTRLLLGGEEGWGVSGHLLAECSPRQVLLEQLTQVPVPVCQRCPRPLQRLLLQLRLVEPLPEPLQPHVVLHGLGGGSGGSLGSPACPSTSWVIPRAESQPSFPVERGGASSPVPGAHWGTPPGSCGHLAAPTRPARRGRRAAPSPPLSPACGTSQPGAGCAGPGWGDARRGK